MSSFCFFISFASGPFPHRRSSVLLLLVSFACLVSFASSGKRERAERPNLISRESASAEFTLCGTSQLNESDILNKIL